MAMKNSITPVRHQPGCSSSCAKPAATWLQSQSLWVILVPCYVSESRPIQKLQIRGLKWESGSGDFLPQRGRRKMKNMWRIYKVSQAATGDNQMRDDARSHTQPQYQCNVSRLLRKKGRIFEKKEPKSNIIKQGWKNILMVHWIIFKCNIFQFLSHLFCMCTNSFKTAMSTYTLLYLA